MGLFSPTGFYKVSNFSEPEQQQAVVFPFMHLVLFYGQASSCTS